jgi:hypothetical protein
MCFYHFAPAPDPNTFIFPTDRGWLYTVELLNRSETFKGNDILENNGLFFEMIFGRSPLDKPERGEDRLVQPTILEIITNQFDANGILPFYYFVCDTQNR